MIKLTYCLDTGCASTAPLWFKFAGEIWLEELDLASCNISSSDNKCQYLQAVTWEVHNKYLWPEWADYDNYAWDPMSIRTEKKIMCASPMDF